MALARWEVEAWMQPGDLLDPRGLFPLRPAWMAQGACRGSEVDFFPGRGEAIEPAKRLCIEVCPVRDQCLSYALDDRELSGVWGGTSERERRRMRKEQGPRPRRPRKKNIQHRTECAKGHSYNETNTYVTPQGHRQCRLCRREYMRQARSSLVVDIDARRA